MSGRRSRTAERIPADEIVKDALFVAEEEGIAPRWRELLERGLRDLLGMGAAGERLLSWYVTEFWHGRVCLPIVRGTDRGGGGARRAEAAPSFSS
jgi:hypothetical protein